MKVFKKCIVSSSILLFLFIFIPTVHAEEGQMYRVNTDVIELKTSPEADSSVIGELIKDDKLTIFDKKSGWVKTFYGGEAAWVKEKNLQAIYRNNNGEYITDDQPTSSYKVITAKGELINLPSESKKLESPELKSASMEISMKEDTPLTGYSFIVDAGHGGKDSGAIAQKSMEKDVTLSTARIIAEKLKSEGADVTLTRTDDTFISLEERVNKSNSSKADAFISVHYNANTNPKAAGLSTFYYSNKHKMLAKEIQSSLVLFTSMTNRGIKQANYKVLRTNKKPAVLLELGFMTNPNELTKIQTTAYQKNTAKGIVEGMKAYYDKRK